MTDPHQPHVAGQDRPPDEATAVPPATPAVDSFATEPPAQSPADPASEVPATLADETPAEPAQPIEPAADASGDEPSSGSPTSFAQTYEDAAEPAATAPVEAAPADAEVVAAPDSEAVDAGPAPAEPVDVEPAPAEPAPDEPVAARRRSRAWLPVTAIGLAVALLAGTVGFLAWQLRQQSRTESARPEAIAAARDAARLLFSYNHETLEEDFAKGLAVTTGGFRDEYSRTTSEVVAPVAEQYDAVVVAEVVEASVVEAEAGKVIALVFLNQGTTSTRVKGQQVDQSRVRMHLVERDGEWLVAAVEAL